MHLEALSSAGVPLISTVGPPGSQGPVMTGTHGPLPGTGPIGLRFTGFAGDRHGPNDGMFAIGMMSITVAAGLPSIITGGPLGITVSGPGAEPNVQRI